MKGVFLDLDTLERGDLDLSMLRKTLPEWTLRRTTRPADVPAAVADAHVIVTNKVVLDAPAIAAAPHARLICVAATGTNNVDLDATAEHGIIVSNARGYATTSVVEHVFALVLSLLRNMDRYRAAVAAGAWHRSENFCLLDYPITELSGRTLGVIGHGELGHAVGKLGEAFGMKVLVAERRAAPLRPGRVVFEEVLRRADVLTLHCPLTPETEGLIGPAELSLMKPDALLINAARGGIVDEQALVDALRSDRLGGAAVDVLTREPPVDGNPLLEAGLDNLIVTPHIAWASRAARQRLIGEITRNIEAFLAGSPRNVV